MISKRIQNFKGKINDIKVENEQIFLSTEFILENIEEKFNIKINDKEYTKFLISTIEDIYSHYDEFSFATLENSFYRNINEAENLKELSFDYDGSTWKIEELNKKVYFY